MKIQLTPTELESLTHALPLWSMQFDYACILNSNHCASACDYDTYEIIAGVANKGAVTYSESNTLNLNNKWQLGYLGYENRNHLHGIISNKPTKSGFDSSFFFEPEFLITIKKGSSEVEVHGNLELSIQEIMSYPKDANTNTEVKLTARVTRENYIDTIEQIKENIIKGTFYELNYCMEFYQDEIEINPGLVFNKLLSISPTPFASFFKHNQQFLMCASPERFIKKTSRIIISQPIKGTIKRGKNKDDDEALKTKLKQSDKERAENIMIVDLMRNDLAQCALTGTVRVDELFGLYTFATVHQLISTVSATLVPEISLLEILDHTFPMGSMTGAPKREVMHFIAQIEPTARGLFSGSVGYVNPNNDFDFNVVIRSITYNQDNRYLSCHVGSAITYDADAAAEYEECLLKAETMFKALDTHNPNR